MMAKRPVDPEDYLRRVFTVYVTLDSAVEDSAHQADGSVRVADLSPVLTSVLWSVTDSQLQSLNKILNGISSKINTIHLSTFAIRVPLEISEPICRALTGQPIEDSDAVTPPPLDEVSDADTNANNNQALDN